MLRKFLDLRRLKPSCRLKCDVKKCNEPGNICSSLSIITAKLITVLHSLLINNLSLTALFIRAKSIEQNKLINLTLTFSTTVLCHQNY